MIGPGSPNHTIFLLSHIIMDGPCTESILFIPGKILMHNFSIHRQRSGESLDEIGGNGTCGANAYNLSGTHPKRTISLAIPPHPQPSTPTPPSTFFFYSFLSSILHFSQPLNSPPLPILPLTLFFQPPFSFPFSFPLSLFQQFHSIQYTTYFSCHTSTNHNNTFIPLL